jgi:hypothetical protein
MRASSSPNGRVDVGGEAGHAGQVGDLELDPAVHEVGDEGNPPGEPVHLGDEELGAGQAAPRDGLGELGPVVVAAALDLLELRDDLPVAAVEEGRHGVALGVQAEAGLALAVGAHPEVGDVAAGGHLLGSPIRPIRRF